MGFDTWSYRRKQKDFADQENGEDSFDEDDLAAGDGSGGEGHSGVAGAGPQVVNRKRNRQEAPNAADDAYQEGNAMETPSSEATPVTVDDSSDVVTDSDNPAAFHLWTALPASLRYALIHRIFSKHGCTSMRFVCREWMSACNAATHSVTLRHASRRQPSSTAADVEIVARHLPRLKKLKLEYDSKVAFSRDLETLEGHMGGMTQLQSLCVEFIRGPPYYVEQAAGNFDFRCLTSLRDLKELNLDCGILPGSVAGLIALTGLTRTAPSEQAYVMFDDLKTPGLRSYRLNCCSTTPCCIDLMLRTLGPLPSLRALYLPRIQLLASSLQAFLLLPNLREVELVLAFQVHPEQLRPLSQLRHLQSVALRFTEPIGSQMGPALAALPGTLALALAQLPPSSRGPAGVGAGDIIDLRPLTQLTSLAGYACAGQPVASLVQLTALRSLRTVGGLSAAVAGCRHLTELEAGLWLEDFDRPYGHLSGLSELVSLRRLVLKDTVHLSTEEVKYVGCLTNLSSLSLMGCYNLDGANLATLSRLTHLSELALENIRALNHDGLEFLRGMLDLRVLMVRQTQLAYVSAEPLAGLSKLGTLLLYHGVSHAAREFLRAQLPKIVYFYVG